MKILDEALIPYNTGKSFIVKKGHVIRISAESVADFVAFNLDNLKERFEQATTKGYNGKVFISKGDKLYSNYHNTMMTIIEDTYKGYHDLQYTMCSKLFYDRHCELFMAGDPAIIRTFGNWLTIKSRGDLPDHGCLENIYGAIKDFHISIENIPNPFDLFQNSKIVGLNGELIADPEEVRPEQGKPVHIDFLANINCLVALSVCPDFYAKASRGKSASVSVFKD